MDGKLKVLDEKDMERIAGGDIEVFATERNGNLRTVVGAGNYLAFLREPNYEERNEVGRLYNGEQVEIVGGRYQGPDGRIYVVIYSPQYSPSLPVSIELKWLQILQSQWVWSLQQNYNNS